MGQRNPDLHNQRTSVERYGGPMRQSGVGQQGLHLRIGETEARMGVALAQFLPAMRGEIDDRHAPARPQHARRFRYRQRRILREMEHLMEQDGVEALSLIHI